MRIIAQDRSAPLGRRHQAAVRLPSARPSERQVNLGPRTRTCPVDEVPRAPPNTCTSASRAWIPELRGHGWLARQVPSISRAAMPAIRRRGPSAHQTGPSPSHTRVGVQVKVCPAAITVAAIRLNTSIHAQRSARPNQSTRPTMLSTRFSRPRQLGYVGLSLSTDTRLPCGSIAIRLTLSMSSIRST